MLQWSGLALWSIVDHPLVDCRPPGFRLSTANEVIRRVGCNRLSVEVASEAVRTGSQYRIDERLGECKPFHQVVVHSLERTMRRFGVEQPGGRRSGGVRGIPTRGAYPGVSVGAEALGRVSAGDRGERDIRPDRPSVRVWVTGAFLDC